MAGRHKTASTATGGGRLGGDSIEIRHTSDNVSLAYTEGTTASFKLNTATPVKIKAGFGHPDSQYPYISHVMLWASSGNDVAYAPYVGTSTPFTLPAEHPYLAKLPDGTADTIEVDKEGNVSLVARVGKSIIPKTNINVSDELQNGSDGTSNRVVIFGSLNAMPIGTSLSGSCSMFVNGDKTQNRDTIRIGYSDRHVYLYTVDEDIIGDGSADAVNAWVRSNQPVITYPLETPVTYQLDKVTVPSLPESISNVWTDAEVTPRTSIEYVRDVNIVVANLETAIASITEG